MKYICPNCGNELPMKDTVFVLEGQNSEHNLIKEIFEVESKLKKICPHYDSELTIISE